MRFSLIQVHFNAKSRAARRAGFTLVEILVAVAIMSLLLAIILVPLRLSFETYHIGTARTGLQQEIQLTMQQINKDFLRADFVFPNARIRGISDNTSDTTSACSLQPYKTNNLNNAADWKYLPYFRSNVAPTGVNTDPYPPANGIGVTNVSTTLKAFANTSRIDMLFLRRSKTGISAQTGEDYVVSYYPRRLNINDAYDVIDNPIVLFRAQYPYRRRENTGFQPQPAPTNPLAKNAETDWTQYPLALGAGSNNADVDRSFKWITHNYFGETNLEPLCIDASDVPATLPNTIEEDVIGSHTLITPRGMQLVAPSATSGNPGSFIPELSFVEASSDGKRIDRVTINMTLAQYDQAGAASVNGQGKAQRVPVSQTFDLPNATCSN